MMDMLPEDKAFGGKGTPVSTGSVTTSVETMLAMIVAASLVGLTGFAMSMSSGDVASSSGYSIAFTNMYRTCSSISTLLFSLSGARAAIQLFPKSFLTGGIAGWRSAWSVYLSGLLTGVGGGLCIRDPILLREPTALIDPSLLAWAFLGTTMAIALTRDRTFIDDVVDAFDFIAVGMTAVFAVDIAREYLASYPKPGLVNCIAAFVAVTSAAGGGIVRDFLILRRPPYATTSMYIGVIVVTTLTHATFVVFGSFSILSQAHDIWPGTVILALVFGMSTRKYRFGLGKRTLGGI